MIMEGGGGGGGKGSGRMAYCDQLGGSFHYFESSFAYKHFHLVFFHIAFRIDN